MAINEKEINEIHSTPQGVLKVNLITKPGFHKFLTESNGQ